MVAQLPNLETQERAVSRVAELVRKVAAALDASGVPYAVIGGNAVAAWVATVDEDAVRATKDVDILLRRSDLDAAANALRAVSLEQVEALGITCFVDRDNPKPSAGVHVIFAGDPVRQHDQLAAPDVSAVSLAAAGFRVINLPALLRMKLVAYRRIDQVHVEDMLRVGLIDAQIAGTLPPELLLRLREVRDTMEWHAAPPLF